MVDPDIGLVTNVRAAHLAAFDSLDDIAAAKGEMFAVMRDDATAVVNLDDAHVRVQAARHVGPAGDLRSGHGGRPALEELHSQFYPGTHDRLPSRRTSPTSATAARAAPTRPSTRWPPLAGVVAAGAELMRLLERMEQLEAGPGRGAGCTDCATA